MSKDELFKIIGNTVLSGEDLEKELYEALKETFEKVKEVYQNSGYYQMSEYQAKNNKVKNWYFNASLVLEKYEKLKNINQS